MSVCAFRCARDVHSAMLDHPVATILIFHNAAEKSDRNDSFPIAKRAIPYDCAHASALYRKFYFFRWLAGLT